MRVQISELVDLTGMTWRTITKRLNAAGIGKVVVVRGKDYWDSAQCLAAIYAPKEPTQKDGLTTQRSRLAAEQADRLAMENAIARGQYAPIRTLEMSLAKASASVSASLAAVVPAVKRRIPSLTVDQLEIITTEIARARNLAAKFQLTEKDLDEPANPDSGNQSSTAKRAKAARNSRAPKRKRVGG